MTGSTQDNVVAWADRVKDAYAAWNHWTHLPGRFRMDRALKDAGVRALIVERDEARAEVERLREERQAVLDCINLYGDETLHRAPDEIGWPGQARGKRLLAAAREAAELLSDIGTDDYVNPPTAEAMQRAASELRALTGEARS